MKRKADSYFKEAKVCWIIAGIFFTIAIVGKILVLILTLLGY